MKNRTLIGIVCIVIAVVMVFAVSPLITRMSEQKMIVVRATVDVAKGTLLNPDQFEEVKISKSAVPEKPVVALASFADGTWYASVDIRKGDFLTGAKATQNSTDIDMILESLPDGKVAMTFTVSAVNSLNGKLKAGDIVSLCVTNNKIVTIPLAFKYVKVLTTTTSGGVDEDQVQKKEDGSFTQPSTVTFLLSPRQATLLASYKNGSVRYALVHRGEDKKSEELLAAQDEYLNGLELAAQEAAKQMIAGGNVQSDDKEFNEYYNAHRDQFIKMMDNVFETVFGMKFQSQNDDDSIYDDVEQTTQQQAQPEPEAETAPQDQATAEEEG